MTLLGTLRRLAGDDRDEDPSRWSHAVSTYPQALGHLG